MTHPGSQNEAKMRLRGLPWGALGASWGSPGVSCGVPWSALACSGGSLIDSLGCFGGLLGCPWWLLACTWVFTRQNGSKLQANLIKKITKCVKIELTQEQLLLLLSSSSSLPSFASIWRFPFRAPNRFPKHARGCTNLYVFVCAARFVLPNLLA